MNESLVLEALEVTNLGRWRWRLADSNGAVLAEHEARLDAADWEYTAFTDLDRYLRLHTASSYVVAEEATLVEQVGRWAGAAALGETVGSVLTARAPATVRVLVPAGGEFLSAYPLEIAHIDGQPMARRGVTLVFEYGEIGARAATLMAERPVRDRLRVLALFSLPVGGSMLALRKERYELARLIEALRTRSGLAVELRVLQYGVTRERLAKEATDGEGWDILHISGHGQADSLVLEMPDGSADFVRADDLVLLLAPARRRLKFAVLSSCNSGAATVAETLRWLGFAEQPDAEAARAGTTSSMRGSSSLARALVDRLGVAVLGMRYPVQDEFAIALARELYPALLEGGQPVDIAVGRAIHDAIGPRPTVARPPLSICTPALFGPAAGLTFSPPAGPPEPSEAPLAGFPLEPQRFVGRTPAILAASAALAPSSGRTTVVFHGMAGIGKTSCALELAYQHRDAFETLVWWQAPEQDQGTDQALISFAATLESRCEEYGFTMVDSVSSPAGIERLLPRLTALLNEHDILLVLDNVETLLLITEGSWRDPRWGRLFDALTSHGGRSRLVVASRAVPPVTASGTVLVEAVNALSLEETVLLARELPSLRILLNAESGPVRVGAGQTVADRALALRTLRVVQGHPKLLELADAAAANPHDLAARLDAAQTALADRDQALGTFFATGATALESKDIFTALGAWTADTFASLPAAARLMVSLLACMQEGDRTFSILESAWPELWRVLAEVLPDPPPASPEALSPLIATALVQAEPPSGGDPRSPIHYRLHPAIADTLRDRAPQMFVNAANQVMAQFWYETFQHARTDEPRDEEWIVHSSLSAAPYLLYLQEWNALGAALESAIMLGSSDATTKRALTYLNHPGPSGETRDALRWRIMLGKALGGVDRVQAEQLQRSILKEASDKKWYDLAWVAAGDLLRLLISLGRMADAVAMAAEKKTLRERAGLGQWVSISDEVVELDLEFRQRHDPELRERAENLIARMESLPVGVQEAFVSTWSVRDDTLRLGLRAAIAFEEWERALELNRRILENSAQRGGDLLAQAYVRINDYGPLMRLGRPTEALELVVACQQIFMENDEIDAAGNAFASRAIVEFALNRTNEAIHHLQTALRYLYTGPIAQLEFSAIADCHYNLGNMLTRAKRGGRDIPDAIAHLMAAATIGAQFFDQSGAGKAVSRILYILRAPGSPGLPDSFEVVCQTVEQVPGVRFQELLEAMLPDPAHQERLFTALCSAVDDCETMPEP
jgi:tetratricopeptide (TPR) repeat protein